MIAVGKSHGIIECRYLFRVVWLGRLWLLRVPFFEIAGIGWLMTCGRAEKE